MELSIEQKETNVETMKHILTIRALLIQCMNEMIIRANHHDKSKLSDPELNLFVEYTPKLKETEYGSEQYKQFLSELKPALDNHYAKNSHHPEHYSNGIQGMNLFDLIEMLCDWKASGLRMKNGNLHKSLTIQKDRFGISDSLFEILENTIPLIERFSEESNIKISYPNY